MPSLIWDYQQMQISVAIDEGEEYYVFRPVGFNGRRQIVSAYQRGEVSDEVFLIIQEEVKIYERRRVEGYLVDRSLDQDRLGPGLGHIVESYCQANERPFPNRGNADLDVPSIELGDIESKVTPKSGEYYRNTKAENLLNCGDPVFG